MSQPTNEDGVKIIGDMVITYHCRVCDGPGKNKCGKCKTVRYCSRECQISDWDDHKQICGHLTWKYYHSEDGKTLKYYNPLHYNDGDNMEHELRMSSVEWFDKLINSYRFRRDQFPNKINENVKIVVRQLNDFFPEEYHTNGNMTIYEYNTLKSHICELIDCMHNIT